MQKGKTVFGMDLFCQLKDIQTLEERIKNCKKPVFLYGMGDGAEKINAHLLSLGITPSGVVASEGFLRGQSFLGFEVTGIKEAESTFGDLCLVLCFGLEGKKTELLKSISPRHTLVSPNLPVAGEGVCDKKYVLENIELFQRLFDKLEDNISKELLVSLLKYNISGDVSHLFSLSGAEEVPKSYFRRNGLHIDVGAYDGDTVFWFLKESDPSRPVAAFEPDPGSFKKLLKNTAHQKNVTCYNKCVGQKSGKTLFETGKGRATRGGMGGKETETVSIDGFCGFSSISAKGEYVGSIKIDAEGMDEAVIAGGANTLFCCKSNLWVSLYHRACDLLELPLLLMRYGYGYKLYLRKKLYVPAWDVWLFAIKEEQDCSQNSIF